MKKSKLSPLTVLLPLGVIAVIAVFVILGNEKDLVQMDTQASEPVLTKTESELPDDAFPHSSFLEENCYKCHDEDVQKGDLRLDIIKWDFNGKSLALWKKIYKAVHSEQMPPKKKAPVESKQSFLDLLKAEFITNEKIQLAENGRSSWRRLTRKEYENTLKDVLGMPHLNVARFLPEDGEVHGFNKLSDALDFSAVHLKSYMDAADAILAKTLMPIEQPTAKVEKTKFSNHARIPEYNQGKQIGNEFHIYTNGFSGLHVRPATLDKKVSSPGYYKIKFQAKTVNKKSAHVLRVFSEGNTLEQSDEINIKYLDVVPGKWQSFELKSWMEAEAKICFTAPENIHKRSGHTIWKQPGIAVKSVEVSGPYYEEWPVKRYSKLWQGIKTRKLNTKKTIYVAYKPRDIETKASELLSAFLPRLFRRPLMDNELDLYLSIFKQRISSGDGFQNALSAAYKGALCSPAFLYKQVKNKALSQVELAERLSFFLWNSAPDDKLLSLAEKGDLKGQRLSTEINRLINDKRSERFVQDFNEQWLNLDELYVTSPDPRLFPEANPLLFDCMQMETNKFMQHLIKNDLSILNIIDSDFALLNSRLARHYKIPNVKGMDMQLITLPADSKRGGLITHGSVLKVTANGTVTSPITRGVWFLENILGSPPPPPPSSVPAFEPEAGGAKSLREGLAEHRTNTACAGCHKKIDPPGFAFENYDPIGGYREKYRRYHKRSYALGKAVESGDVFKGKSFKTMEDFKKLLLRDKEQLVRNFIDKILVYSTGNATSFSDEEEVNRIIAAVSKNNFGTRSLLHEVIKSSLFTGK